MLTPDAVASWWMRYIVPENGTVLDPFCGAGSMGKAAARTGVNFVGIEQTLESCEMACRRIAEVSQQEVLKFEAVA